MMTIKDKLSYLLLNLSPKFLSEKILVIESDDWGAIRSPGIGKNQVDTYEHSGPYRLDTLENEIDIEIVLNELAELKSGHGQSPVLTANFLTTNPDFNRIRESGYEHYYSETIDESYNRVGDSGRIKQIWKDSIVRNLVSAQFHGREHVNIGRWMKALRNGHPGTRNSFGHGATYSGLDDYSYMETFDYDQGDDFKDKYSDAIKEGIEQFYSYFGNKPLSFTPPCYTLSPELFPVLRENGIESIQGMKYLIIPHGGISNYKYKRRFQGIKTAGMVNLVRNVELEPSLDMNKDWIDRALSQTKMAFNLKQPAIVSTHRINYVGGVEEANRDNGVKTLRKFILEVIKHWPEVRFMSSSELAQIYK